MVSFESLPHGESVAAGAADRIVERLAERLGGRATVAAVFGAPVERDGVTVIPVARVRWGLGVRGPVRRGTTEEDARGGGGVLASPVGYIEIRDGRAEFRPIKASFPAWAIPLMILAGGVNAWLLLRGLRALLRG